MSETWQGLRSRVSGCVRRFLVLIFSLARRFSLNFSILAQLAN